MSSSATPSAPSTQGNLAAIGLMALAATILPVMDIAAKYLTGTLPPLEVTFGRFFFQMVVCVGLAVVTGNVARLKGKRPGINLLRGSLLAISSLFFFTAVKFMSVATALAIFFVEPMVLTLLAALLLKEKFGVRRFGAILVGLVGAMMILRPNFLALGFVSLLPLATAVCFACYLLVSRKFAGADGLFAIQFGASVAGCLIIGALLVVGTLAGIEEMTFVLPTGRELGLAFVTGAVSFAGHGLVVSAMQRGEAGALAPLQYIEIVSATVLGYMVFGDFPDAVTWAGIGLIVAGGLYIAHRERKLQGKDAPVSIVAKG